MTGNSFGALDQLTVGETAYDIFRLDRVETDGKVRELTATVRIDTPAEAAYFQHGGILPYVLRRMLAD